MRILLSLSSVLALAGCSLVFPPDQYTRGADAGSGVDAARDDGAVPEDASPIDASPIDASPIDASPIDASLDATVGDGGSGTPGAWPTCGNGIRESASATDVRGQPLELTDALYGALFAGAMAGGGELGLVGDRELPGPAAFVDVAVAPGIAAGTVVVAAAAGDELRVHVVGLAGGLAFGSPLTVSWAGGEPSAIERIAMRTIGGTTRIGVLGRSGVTSARGWACDVGATVSCGAPLGIAMPDQLDGVAVAADGAGDPVVFFAGRDGANGYAFRLGDLGTEPVVRSFQPADRLSGTNGPLVLAAAAGLRDPFGYLLGASGFFESDLGARGGPTGMGFLGGTLYAMVQAENDADGNGFALGARPVACATPGGCTCTSESGGDCGASLGFTALVSPTGDARFVEVERAGDAVLAWVGEGADVASTSGTDVSLYAFARTSSAPIQVTPTSARAILGSGMAGPDFVGTLVPGVGMRAAVVPTASGFDLVDVALVDLSASGGTPTRRVFVSALRICRAR